MTSAGRQRPSIRRKLDRLVLVSVGVALVIVCALNVWSEADRYLVSRRETLFATGQVFGAAMSKAVAASDSTAVLQGLRAIGRVPGLVSAEVRDRRGESLAMLGSAARLGGDVDFDDSGGGSLLGLLTSGTVQMAVPVIDGGVRVGQLVLVGDTRELAGRFVGVLEVAVAGSALALCLGLVLSSRLQRSITRPLAALATAMAGVERTGAYVPFRGEAGDDETRLLAARYNSMIDEIGRATDEILAREDEIIARLSRAGEQRDDQTGQHVVRVARISRVIADELGLDPVYATDLCRASPMHDVGKISIPDAILFKPGRLDAQERQIMEQHALSGHSILAGSGAKLVQLAAEIALTHHEKWDGTGYPNGLAADAIPLSGRITAVADVCDALLSVRPYKQPWTLEAVQAHLAENSGLHFDPTCVNALLARWLDLTEIYGPERIETPARTESLPA